MTPPGLEVFLIDVGGRVFAFLTHEVSRASSLPPLSNAERAVMRAILDGKSNAEIAKDRGTAERTVANQAQRLFQKLGVRSRGELAARFGVDR